MNISPTRRLATIILLASLVLSIGLLVFLLRGGEESPSTSNAEEMLRSPRADWLAFRLGADIYVMDCTGQQ
jgi:hypothetical protein